MDLLPKEVVLLILENLNVKSKYNFCMTCMKYLKYKPTVYFTVFITYTEDEGNIVSEFIGLSDTLHNAKLLIEKFTTINSYYKKDINPSHPSMDINNNFTFIGKRDKLWCNHRNFRTLNGFVIEPTWINNISKSGNI